MLRVGLTGGLATGKSFVGQALVDLGCHLLKADEIGHAALLPGGEAYQPVVDLFGPAILDAEGRIVRRRLGAAVFGQPDLLARLNAIVHPVVIAEEETWMRRLETENANAIAVVEAAILIETGSYLRFHRIILTHCEEHLQMERAMKRDGLSREEVEARLKRQMPLEEKRRLAHFLIDTSGEKAQTVEQVREVFVQLRSLSA